MQRELQVSVQRTERLLWLVHLGTYDSQRTKHGHLTAYI
jgi:hypothetical protein